MAMKVNDSSENAATHSENTANSKRAANTKSKTAGTKDTGKANSTKEPRAVSTRMLIQSSPAVKLLMLKRGRMLRTGTVTPVVSLKSSDKSQSWLSATVAGKNGDHSCPGKSPRDLAQELASQVKRELGQSVFIDPDAILATRGCICRSGH